MNHSSHHHHTHTVHHIHHHSHHHMRHSSLHSEGNVVENGTAAIIISVIVAVLSLGFFGLSLFFIFSTNGFGSIAFSIVFSVFALVIAIASIANLFRIISITRKTNGGAKENETKEEEKEKEEEDPYKIDFE